MEDCNRACLCLRSRETGVRAVAGQVVSNGAVRAFANLQASVLLLYYIKWLYTVLELFETLAGNH